MVWQTGTIRNQLERVATRREIVRRLRITAYVFGACAFLGWLGVCATHFMVRSLVAKVPPEWEQKFGDEQIAELKGEGVLLDDSNRDREIDRPGRAADARRAGRNRSLSFTS